MTQLTPQQIRSLQSALGAYLQRDGGTITAKRIRQSAGALLSAQVSAGQLLAEGIEIEAWVDALIQGFDPSQRVDGEAEAEAIATQAQAWETALVHNAKATLDGYVQTYQPELNPDKLQELITTILPVVQPTLLPRDYALALVQTLNQQFDGPAALNRVVDSRWMTLATKAAQLFAQRDLAAAVGDVATAYISKFTPALADIGEGLIAEALQALLNSQGALDLDINLQLDSEAERLLIQQVSFDLQIRSAADPPSKTAAAIAAQLHSEVDRYRQSQVTCDSLQPTVIETGDSSTGSSALGGEMSVGIRIHPST